MSFLDDLGKNISSKGAKAGTVVKEKTESIKLSNSISAQHVREKEVYERIGKIYFDLHKDDENIDEQYQKDFADVKAILEDIASLTTQLNALKKTVTCPRCGAEVPKTAAFCGNCGNKMDTEG